MNLSTRDLMDISPAAMYTCDRNGLITYYNKKAAELWGREPLLNDTQERFCGCYRVYFLDGTYVPPPKTPMAQVLRDGKPVRDIEAIVERPDGSRITAAVNIIPLTENGVLAGALNCFLDITDRKNRELEISAKNQELYQLNEKLRIYNEELQQFATVASHDLQEPLRMVSMFTDLLEKSLAGIADEEIRNYMKMAREGAVRSKALIDSLLEYAQTQSDCSSFTRVDIRHVLTKAMENLTVSIKESQASITHEALPVIYGDEVRLTQLFQNLLANAIKFRRPGQQPVVHVGAVKSQDGDWVFSVRDNGIGIRANETRKVFSMFYQAHGRNTYPGLGIGLSIAKKIAALHHGRLWVESEEAKGSTFYISIPDQQPSRNTPDRQPRFSAEGLSA